MLIFVEIFHDFGRFFATRIRIRFNEADPDPADQNETDPNGSGSETLVEIERDCMIYEGKKSVRGQISVFPPFFLYHFLVPRRKIYFSEI